MPRFLMRQEVQSRLSLLPAPNPKTFKKKFGTIGYERRYARDRFECPLGPAPFKAQSIRWLRLLFCRLEHFCSYEKNTAPREALAPQIGRRWTRGLLLRSSSRAGRRLAAYARRTGI
jgi:hypothetical protein